MLGRGCKQGPAARGRTWTHACTPTPCTHACTPTRSPSNLPRLQQAVPQDAREGSGSGARKGDVSPSSSNDTWTSRCTSAPHFLLCKASVQPASTSQEGAVSVRRGRGRLRSRKLRWVERLSFKSAPNLSGPSLNMYAILYLRDSSPLLPLPGDGSISHAGTGVSLTPSPLSPPSPPFQIFH